MKKIISVLLFIPLFLLVNLSHSTETVEAAGTIVLSAPSLNLSKNGLSVTANWNSTPGASGYAFHYASSPYQSGDPIYRLDMQNQQSLTAKLWEGAAFYIAVTAYHNEITSEYSNIIQFNISDGLKFSVEDGIRLDHAAQVFAVSRTSEGEYRTFEPEYNGIYLTYKNTQKSSVDDVTQVNTTNIAYSDDGIAFSEGNQFSINDRPGVQLPQPDENGNTIYRKFILTSEGLSSKTSTDGGKTYQSDDEIRYFLQQEDKNSIGYYDSFNNGRGQIILLYIGAFGFPEENIRLAISEDNGETFQFRDANPLQDSGLSATGYDHRDPRVTMLADGRLRLFSMVQGVTGAPIPGTKSAGLIYSHSSEDGGYTWTKDEGIRLSKDDFNYDVWSLNDPHVVPIGDGRYRMYVTALIADDDPNNTFGYKEVIISAVTQ